MLLYHGGSIEKLTNMVTGGFRQPRERSDHGDNFGKTYGSGLYFSPDFEFALSYSKECGYDKVIRVNLPRELKLYKQKLISPTNRSQRRNLNRLRRKLIDGGEYDGFIVQSKDDDGNVIETEIIIWNPTFIPKENLDLC